MQSLITPNVIMPSVNTPNVIKLSVITPSLIMLNIITPSVIMPNVAASRVHLRLDVVVPDGADTGDGFGDVAVDDGHRSRRHPTQKPRRRQISLKQFFIEMKLLIPGTMSETFYLCNLQNILACELP